MPVRWRGLPSADFQFGHFSPRFTGGPSIWEHAVSADRNAYSNPGTQGLYLQYWVLGQVANIQLRLKKNEHHIPSSLSTTWIRTQLEQGSHYWSCCAHRICCFDVYRLAVAKIVGRIRQATYNLIEFSPLTDGSQSTWRHPWAWELEERELGGSRIPSACMVCSLTLRLQGLMERQAPLDDSAAKVRTQKTKRISRASWLS